MGSPDSGGDGYGAAEARAGSEAAETTSAKVTVTAHVRGWSSGSRTVLGDEPHQATVAIDRDGWWGVGTRVEPETGAVVHGGAPVAEAEVRVWSDARPGVWASASDRDGRVDLPSRVGLRHAEAVAQQGASGRRLRGAAEGAGLATIGLSERRDRDGDGAWRPDDCDDDDPRVHPGAERDPPGGLDENCDGHADGIDADHDGWTSADGGDCDDGDPSVHPDAAEACNDRDDDCSASTTEDAPPPGSVVLHRTSTCVPCSPEGVVALEPKLYWRLAEADAVRDSSGFGRDGEPYGAPSFYRGITAWPEDAPRFAGEQDSVALDVPLFDHPVTELSFAAWIRMDQYHRVVATWSTAVEGDGACVDGSTAPGTGALSIGFDGSDLTVGRDDEVVRTTASVATGTWTHVVVTFDLGGGRATVYVDGSPTLVHLPGVATELPATGRMVLGAALIDGSDEFPAVVPSLFEGMIDEVAVFDRILSDDDVQTLHDLAPCATDPCVFGHERDCAAPTCAEIVVAGTYAGPSTYWLQVGEDGSETDLGNCYEVDGEVRQLLCGDGQADDPVAHADPASAPWLPAAWPGGVTETCDDGGSPAPDGCFSCARLLGPATGRAYPHCQAIADADAVPFAFGDGPYRVADPDRPGQTDPVRCRMDDDPDTGERRGWTLVFFHDARSGTRFAPDADADFLPDAEEALYGADENDDDTDGDGRQDGDEVLDGTNPVDPDDVGLDGPNFFVVRPPQGASTEYPFGLAYSILGQLDRFRGPNEGFEFELAWPCLDPDGEFPDRIRWRQKESPTEALPTKIPEGFWVDPRDQVPAQFKGLTYRSDSGDAYLGTPSTAPRYLVGHYEAGLDPCSGWLRIDPGGTDAFCDGNGNAPAVELWVRPW